MRGVLFFQGVYYIVTGIWPLVDLLSFYAVTGPKRDHWLVQTVGVLAALIGTSLLFGCLRSSPNRETLALAVLAAIGFTAVDVVFTLMGVISPIYLVDAAVQVVLMVALGIAAVVASRSSGDVTRSATPRG